MQTVGITGATGYVGSLIERALLESNYEVVRLVRQPRSNSTDRQYALDGPLSEDLLDGLDSLVLCAWDMRLTDWTEVQAVNIDGSNAILNAADQGSISRVIFISSMSAFEKCSSNYGRAKLLVEEQVRRIEHGVVVRPGLIYGESSGGMVGALLGIARLSPLLPMVGLGNYKLHTCHVEDLSSLVCSYAAAAPLAATQQPILAAEATGRPFKTIVRTLAGKNLFFIPVPWRLAWLVLRLLESLGIRMRMKSDSLIGLVRSDPAPDFSAQHRLPVTFRPLS